MYEPISTSIEVAPGVELRAIHRTGGDGIPYLLIHGLASNARLWDEVAIALGEAGHDSLAVDQRGHGESTQVTSGFDFATLSADLLAVIQAMGWSKAIAVGQSWGANVVLELAARHPEGVAGVGLVDGGFLRLRDEFASWSDVQRELAPPGFKHMSLDAIRSMMASHMVGFPASGLEAQLANFLEAPDGTVRSRLQLQNHLAILQHLWEHDPDESGSRVTAPIQAIAVNGERQAKRDRVASFAAATGAEVHWQDGHHDIHAQQPQVVADLLLRLAAEVAT